MPTRSLLLVSNTSWTCLHCIWWASISFSCLVFFHFVQLQTEANCIVIDLGSGSCKAGYSSESSRAFLALLCFLHFDVLQPLPCFRHSLRARTIEEVRPVQLCRTSG